MKDVMLEINEQEKELLLNEIGKLAGNINSSEKTRNEFEKLLSAVNEQIIDGSQLSVLSQVLELLLTTGEIRKTYNPIEEQKLFRLYVKTPAGAEQKERIEELNYSLKALQQQTIEDISFSLKLPGVYGITIKTNKCELSLSANQFGVYADKLEMEI